MQRLTKTGRRHTMPARGALACALILLGAHVSLALLLNAGLLVRADLIEPGEAADILKALKGRAQIDVERSEDEEDLQVDQVAGILSQLINEGELDYDDELGSLGELLDGYNEIYDSRASCSMERQQQLIRLLVNFYQTPLGEFINVVRENQKAYCWATFSALLAEKIDELPSEIVSEVIEFGTFSELAPEEHIFSVDPLAESLVEDALRKSLARGSSLFHRAESKRVRYICAELMRDRQIGDFLWLLKIIKEPKMSDLMQNFLLGAKLCQSLVETRIRSIKVPQ